jgi:hypothetical protein
VKITFLHTTSIHIETIDALFDEVAPTPKRIHHGAPEMLASPQFDGLLRVTSQTAEMPEQLSNAYAVLCKCSSLGPLGESFAQTHPNIVQIYRPMMEVALQIGTKIIAAICLESTRNATLASIKYRAKNWGDNID